MLKRCCAIINIETDNKQENSNMDSFSTRSVSSGCLLITILLMLRMFLSSIKSNFSPIDRFIYSANQYSPQIIKVDYRQRRESA